MPKITFLTEIYTRIIYVVRYNQKKINFCLVIGDDDVTYFFYFSSCHTPPPNVYTHKCVNVCTHLHQVQQPDVDDYSHDYCYYYYC